MFFTRDKERQNVFLYERIRVDNQEKCEDIKILDYPVSIKIKENEIIFFTNFINSGINPEAIRINFNKTEDIDIFVALFQEKKNLNTSIYTKLDDKLFYSRLLNEQAQENNFSHFFKHSQKNLENKNVFNLSELFLDFLYEFFYTETFRKMSDYEDIKKKLLKIKFIEFLKAKYDYLLAKDSIPGSVTHRKYTRKWLDLLQSEEAGRFVTKSNLWFDDVHKEMKPVAFDIAKYYSNTDMYEKAMDWEIANLQYWQSWKMLFLKNDITKFSVLILLELVILFLGGVFSCCNITITNLWYVLILMFFLAVFMIVSNKDTKYILKDFIKLLSFEIIVVSVLFWKNGFFIGSGKNISLDFLIVVSLFLLSFFVGILYSIDKKISLMNSFIIIIIAFFYTFIAGIFYKLLENGNQLLKFSPEIRSPLTFENLIFLILNSTLGTVLGILTFILTKLRIKTKL